MNFLHVFLIFFVISAICLLWPLFRGWREHKRHLREDVRTDYSGAVIQDRAKELEETKAIGEISDTEFNSLQKDLEKTIAAEEQGARESSSRAITFGGKSRVTLFVLCLFLPLLSFIMYTQLGAKADWVIAQETKALFSNANPSEEQQLELIKKVKSRLSSKPNNESLLFLLGELSTITGDFEEAVTTYRNLKEMFPESAEVAAQLAQALFLRAGNVITPEMRENTRRALELNPNLPDALGYAGIDSFQQGDYEQAITFWQLAVKQLDPSSTASQFLTQGIARAKLALEQSGNTPSEQAAIVAAPEIKVSVSVSEAVPELTGSETVFVYARAWQGAKIPLAMERLQVSDLPATVALDKDDAMMQGADITTASQLEVVARISKTGTAAPQPGDWIASFGPVILGEQDAKLALEISELVP